LGTRAPEARGKRASSPADCGETSSCGARCGDRNAERALNKRLGTAQVRARLGHLDGFHSIRANKKWRLIFRWDDGKGEASGVYLDDHSYK
jgi:hypothetical protein